LYCRLEKWIICLLNSLIIVQVAIKYVKPIPPIPQISPHAIAVQEAVWQRFDRGRRAEIYGTLGIVLSLRAAYFFPGRGDVDERKQEA